MVKYFVLGVVVSLVATTAWVAYSQSSHDTLSPHEALALQQRDLAYEVRDYLVEREIPSASFMDLPPDGQELVQRLMDVGWQLSPQTERVVVPPKATLTLSLVPDTANTKGRFELILALPPTADGRQHSYGWDFSRWEDR